MKKILLAFDDTHLPEAAFEFVRRLNEINPVLLTGVFLRSVTYQQSSEPVYFEGLGLPAYAHEVETIPRTDLKKKIEWFESLCKKNNIEYRTHDDSEDNIIHELKKETRFADLLILSSGSFYEKEEQAQPSYQLKAILHVAECLY